MKLELESNSLQHSFDHYFLKRNNLEMTDDEIGNMLRIGVKLAQEGNRADARHLLLRVTEADSKNETAWLWLASISEYPEELLIFLQNVLKINPENERAIEWSKATQSLLAKTFVQRGIDASHDNQTDFARQCFLQAIYYDNENEMAWLWLASITEDVEEKILHLQKVLSFNPENETATSSLKALTKESPQSLLRKANSAAVSGDRETAGLMLEEVMQDAPEIEEAWILKAYLANDFYEKLGCYEKVLELNPQNEAAQAGMASLKILMDKVEPSQPNFDSQNEETPESLQAVEVFETENDEEPVIEFAQEISENEFAEENAAQTFQESTANDSYLQIKDETENQLSESESSENPELESSENSVLDADVYEEDLSTVDFQDSAEETSFNSESPTQKLDEIQFESFNFQNESEVELVESQTVETQEFSASDETNDADFSLNGEEDSEIYLIEEEHIPSSYDFILNENEQNNEESQSASETEENSLETNQTTFAETESEVETAYELTNSSETFAGEHVLTNDYYGNFEQPAVEFSGNEQTDFTVSEVNAESVNPSENQFDEPIGFDEEEFESEQPPAEEANVENYVSEPLQAENVNCGFCGFNNDMQAISCGSCRSILSLSDLEMLLAHQDADREILTHAIEMMEAERQTRDFNEKELCLLGIAHLNAKNLRKGLSALQDASKINPNDVVLSSKVNFLAIRLSEIEAQENKNQENASVSRMIMVVDDSPTVRKLISGKLEKSGHTVITANDGVEALSKIAENIPDLILLDIAMPQMDGYQVCKMIRNNEATKDVPVVMISGKDGFFDKVRGKMAGSTGYITKPFGPETLMKTLENYIS